MTGRSLLQQLVGIQPELPDTAGDLQGTADQIAHEISQESFQIQQLSDVAAALTDIAITMENLAEIQPAHLLLMEAGLNMSYAGTTHRADDLSPALESRDALNVSLEGIKERIQEILAMIKRFMLALVEKVREFVTAVAGEIGRAKLRLDTLEIKCDEIDGRMPMHAQVRLGQAVYGLATDRGVPPDALTLGRNIAQMRQHLAAVREHYVPTVLKIGDGFAHALKEWKGTPGNAEAWLARLNVIASAYDVHSFASHVGHTYGVVDARYAANTAVSGAPLPGNRSLVFVDGRKVYPDKMEGTLLDQALALQSSSVDLVRMQVTKTIDPSKAVMRVMTPDEIRDVLKNVSQLLAEIETGAKSRLGADLAQRAKELANTAESMSHHVSTDLDYFRRGMNYCTAFAVWAPKPYTNLLAHAMSVVRASMAACSRHLAAYHRDE